MIAAVHFFALVAAARGPVELQWRAPQGCPEQAHVAARVDALLGPVDPQDDAAIATVDVAAEADGRFTALVRVGGAAGGAARSIAGSSCATLADAVALVIAVHVDALAVGDATELEVKLHDEVVVPEASSDAASGSERASGSDDARGVARASVEPVDAPPPRPRRFALRGALRVGGGASFLALPGVVAPLLDVGAALHVGRARVQLDVGWQLARPARLNPPNEGAGADIGLVAVALRGGWAPRFRTVEIPVLGGVEIGDMTARGVGLSGSSTEHGPWVALLAGAGVAWTPLPAFALVLDPALVVGVGRQRFGARNGGGIEPLYRPRTVGARLQLALEVRFP
ncbi:MAG TPA: hypothetical protein VG755_13005 [Nannocystaceae bacterium]|nr:hypothetical protein [Nannocystaceae bacterium]